MTAAGRPCREGKAGLTGLPGVTGGSGAAPPAGVRGLSPPGVGARGRCPGSEPGDGARGTLPGLGARDRSPGTEPGVGSETRCCRRRFPASPERRLRAFPPTANQRPPERAHRPIIDRSARWWAGQAQGERRSAPTTQPMTARDGGRALQRHQWERGAAAASRAVDQ